MIREFISLYNELKRKDNKGEFILVTNTIQHPTFKAYKTLNYDLMFLQDKKSKSIHKCSKVYKTGEEYLAEKECNKEIIQKLLNIEKDGI